MKSLLAASALLAAATFLSPANADSLKFFTGSGIAPTAGSYTGPFSGAGSVYRAIQGTTTNCPTPAGGCSGGDVTGSPLNYAAAGSSTVAVTATATTTLGVQGGSFVWADYQPEFGGLGVGIPMFDSTDQINSVNVLHLQFAHAVTITGLATLFAPAHEDENGGGFGGITAAQITAGAYTFGFSENGTFTDFNPVLFSAANINNGVAVSGTDFWFKQLTGNPDFYVSGLTYSSLSTGQQCTTGTCVSAVPGPVVGAGLPGLVSACMGLLFLARRRRQPLA